LASGNIELGGDVCLTKTQDSAIFPEYCIESAICQGAGCLQGKSASFLLDAPVNGGCNYDGPKVAKLLVI